MRFFTILLVVFALISCSGAAVERQTARAAVLVTAEAIRASDVACARVVRNTGDRELGVRCDAAYITARASLVSVASAVDVWDAVESRDRVVCSVIAASRDLAALAHEITKKGGDELLVVYDALDLVRRLGVCSLELPTVEPPKIDGGT